MLHHTPHDGPCLIGLDLRPGGDGRPIRDLLRVAVRHAEPLIDAGTSAEAKPADYHVAVQILERPATVQERYVEATAGEWESLLWVVLVGAEYMTLNSYADDHDFPEDAWAAAALGDTGERLTACWAAALR